MAMRLYLRCEAGGTYGIGHAMRLRTIARALRKLAPGLSLDVVGSTPGLHTVFDGEPDVSLHACLNAEDAARFPYDGPVLIDLPFGCLEDRYRWTQQRIIRMDAPWASPAMCDAVILPGVHHAERTTLMLTSVFGAENVVNGRNYLVLPSADTAISVPWEKKEACVAIVESGQTDIITRIADVLIQARDIPARYIARTSQTYESLQQRGIDNLTMFSLQHIANAQFCVCPWGITPYEIIAVDTPVIVLAMNDATFREANIAAHRLSGAIPLVVAWHHPFEQVSLVHALRHILNNQKRYAPQWCAQSTLFDLLGAQRCARWILNHIRKRYGDSL